MSEVEVIKLLDENKYFGKDNWCVASVEEGIKHPDHDIINEREGSAAAYINTYDFVSSVGNITVG